MVPGSSTTLRATWAVPQLIKDSIQGYLIRCNTYERPDEDFRFPGTGTTGILRGLSPYTVYFCHAFAISNSGLSLRSGISAARTDQAGKIKIRY